MEEIERLQIRDWSAIRSGKTQTVSGVAVSTGRPVKITHVVKISAVKGSLIIATTDVGAQIQLVVGG